MQEDQFKIIKFVRTIGSSHVRLLCSTDLMSFLMYNYDMQSMIEEHCQHCLKVFPLDELVTHALNCNYRRNLGSLVCTIMAMWTCHVKLFLWNYFSWLCTSVHSQEKWFSVFVCICWSVKCVQMQSKQSMIAQIKTGCHHATINFRDRYANNLPQNMMEVLWPWYMQVIFFS